jgi:hypothetical protein
MKEPQSLCQRQRNLYVHEIRTSLCERDGRWEKKIGEKKKKKSVLIMGERKEKQNL